MSEGFDICEVRGREILDSRGNPTVEAEVVLENGAVGRASVPSGASTGTHEAVELRDGKERYKGQGVRRAVQNVSDLLGEKILYESALDQRNIDRLLLEADGTENKSRAGANAVLAVSMAAARAAAAGLGLPLYQYLGGAAAYRMPVPMMNILNGGKHADNTVDLQEFMIMPAGERPFSENLRMCAEIYHVLKRILKERGLSTAVGDEGGFAPDLKNSEEALSFLVRAIRETGYEPGRDVKLAIDAAASELYNEETGMYEFPGESAMNGVKVERDTRAMVEYYRRLCEGFPICSLEDGLHEEDWDGWKLLTETLGEKIQLVGDDLFVTNKKRLEKGISLGAGNAILIKMNQIGTLSESMDAIETAKKAGWKTVISHRSGETEDPFLAELAVAVNAGQVKTGAPCRSERVAKYNALLRIEESFQEKTENRK